MVIKLRSTFKKNRNVHFRFIVIGVLDVNDMNYDQNISNIPVLSVSLETAKDGRFFISEVARLAHIIKLECFIFIRLSKRKANT